jgi:CBS domain-containing protein
MALELMKEAGDTVRLFKTGHGTWCWVRRVELEREAADGRRDAPLEEVVRRDPAPRLYRDVGLDSAMRLIGGHAVLPVVSRANPNELVGTLSLSDIHRAYGIVDRAETAAGTQ